jgi:hypothetical protein
MDIKYYYAERKYNELEEQIIIKGYTPIIDMDFHTLITRLNQVADLVDDNNESSIVVQSGNWFYKIETTFYNMLPVDDVFNIHFDYTKYNLAPQVYIAFIGSIVTQL